MLPLIFDFGQHITNFELKIINNNLNASHYLYNSAPFTIRTTVHRNVRVRLDRNYELKQC